MTAALRLATTSLLRAPVRTAVRIAVLAVAVALLGSMLVFVSHSLRTMTKAAVHAVPLDWQGPVANYQQATALAGSVSRAPDVSAATAVAPAPYASAEHAASIGTIRSGAGALLAIPPDYVARFPTLRFLHGSLQPGQIVLDQQLAATLQATVGDHIQLRPSPTAPPQTYTVSGVALVTAPDVLFAPLNPQSGPAPAQPPAQIAILPLDTFASNVAPLLGVVSPASTGTGAPGAPTGVQWQVQANVDQRVFTGDPQSALAKAGQVRLHVEQLLAGQVQFVDNLAERLTGASGDALYAQTLYIMLAVPGALVALGLAYLAALGTAERDRQSLALLRARGASRRDLIVLASVESVVLGIIAGLAGAALALAAVWALVPGSVGLTTGRATFDTAICIALATLGALAARLGATLAALRASIAEARHATARQTRPLWQRLWLDVGCLVLSGLVYWLTLKTGFSAVVNPDSNPTLSLSVYMFFAPALLWLGTTLLLVRLRGRALRMLAGRGYGSGQGRLTGFLLTSAGRRGAAINRGLVLVTLLLAFGVQLSIFTATYSQQSRVDAELTVGADVAVSAPAGSAERLTAAVTRIGGVAAATTVNHNYAYVGPDLQDTYGIDPQAFSAATTLRDSYFLAGSAAQTMQRLAARPDGILVSKETITDYSLSMGDLIRLRVFDHRTGKLVVTPFHIVGIVQEFPSAPKDSFMVTNRSYLERVTGAPGGNVVFARASGDPGSVGDAVAHAVGAAGATVKTIRDQARQTNSSITSVDLTGIARIEEVFAVILAAAALVLYVQLALAERRREFAVMAALSTPLRDISAFVWSEAAVVLLVGAALAVGLGFVLAGMLAAMLTHVFDPPPDQLAIPWGYLAALGGSALAAGLLATLVATRRIRRLPLGAILRE